MQDMAFAIKKQVNDTFSGGYAGSGKVDIRCSCAVSGIKKPSANTDGKVLVTKT